MNENEGLTVAIIEALNKSITEHGLLLHQENSPISPGYSKEWVIQDNDRWCYGSFGIKTNGRYEYTIVSNNSLPFDAQKTLDWVENEIITVFESVMSKTKF